MNCFEQPPTISAPFGRKPLFGTAPSTTVEVHLKILSSSSFQFKILTNLDNNLTPNDELLINYNYTVDCFEEKSELIYKFDSIDNLFIMM